jgi:MazG family protein
MDETPGSTFDRLVGTVARLRGPGGCPWDREQTLETLRPFVLEETYEVLAAIDEGDMHALREEIGDMIFEGVLLAQLCEEAGHFSVAESIASIADKLVRRHPHVFGTERADTAAEVLGRWEEAKARERRESPGAGKPKTILGGVPKTLPALLRAHEMGTRAAAVGFDWERTADVLAKIEEEVAELRQAVEDWGRGQAPALPETDGAASPQPEPATAPATTAAAAHVEEEMGDLLFAIANLSRKLGVEPESALRKADEKFARRFTELERRFASRGESLTDAGLARMEEEWGLIKGQE